eukprot:gene16546-biopygen14095
MPVMTSAAPGWASRLQRWLPQIVVSPLFAISLFFVYGFIVWTIYISLTRSGVMPSYDFAGIVQYERLWATPRWYVALTNLFIFTGLFVALCTAIGILNRKSVEGKSV